MTGTVKSVNKEKGYLFIRGEDGREYFAHRSALKNVRLEELEKDREVIFEDAEGERGLRAEDVYV